jgi:Holliday junction resolvasome RuvABC endonuclease subunit
MIIAGIDYSLNGPAICVANTDKSFCFDNCSFYFLTDVKRNAKTFLTNIHGEAFEDYNEDCERYDTLSDWVMRVCSGCEQIALEGYAYGAQGRVFHIAENTGLLKYKIYQTRTPLTIIPPTEVKKYATGKGNSDKQKMYSSFVLDTNIFLNTIMTPDKKEISSPVSDIVDSFYICKILYNKILDSSS